jgi:hypothetical protein
MRRRFLLTATLVLLAALAYVPSRAAAAGSGGAYPQTDFTLVTPANAIVYATFQSSSARQARALNELAGSIGSQSLLQSLLGTILGAAGGTTGSGGAGGAAGTNIQQLLPLLTGTLARIFNGEFGLAALPPTVASHGGVVTPHLHLLLGAGLQPGVSSGALLFGLAAFGLPVTAGPVYHGFSIFGLDLNQLARTIGKLTNNAQLAKGMLIPANGPIPSTFYGAVAGNDMVLASDLATLKAALDTYRGAQPSIAAGDAFAETVGLLPSERFTTIYFHLDAAVLGTVVRSLLGASGTALAPAQVSTTPGRAFSLTAEPQALLLTMSAPPNTSSITINVP